MSFVLGIDLGTSRTAAAIFRSGRADIIPLSDHTATMPSMVFVRDDSSLLVGDAARRRGQDDASRLARDFKRRFGDSTPLVLGDSSLTAEQLTAALLRHVVAFVTEREGSAPERVVVAHPANWGTYRRELLRREVANTGLSNAELISEPDAAAVHFASGERQMVGEVIAVYDLGGGTFDAAVLRRTADGYEQVGESKGIERLGGIDFDAAVLEHVAEVSGLDAVTVTDRDDSALKRLRDDCRNAKEALSEDDEATVEVNVAGINTVVRITRGEFESMIYPSIKETVHCLRTAILDSGLKDSEISAVLMVGGSSRIPLAARTVTSELRRPVVFTSHPKESVALGAARAGSVGPPEALTNLDSPRPGTNPGTAPLADKSQIRFMAPVESPGRRSRPSRWIAGAAGFAAVAGAGAILLASGGGSKEAAQPTAGTSDEIAVAGLGSAASTSATSSTTTIEPVVSTPPDTISTAQPTTALSPLPLVANLVVPRGLFALADGTVLVSDNHRIVRIGTDGQATALAGELGATVLNGPEGLAVRSDGSIVFADNGSNRILALSPEGVLTVIAGTGQEGYGGDGGPATSAVLDGPVGVAITGDGSVVFADNDNHRIRMIDPNGVISTIAGTGISGLGSDGPATQSALKNPQGVAIARDGSIIFSDTFNHRIRRLLPDGTAVTIAGSGTKGSNGDGGPAVLASLNLPVGVVELYDGSIAIADYGNGKVRFIRADGSILTLAGTGTQGFAGDGGPATAAQLNRPQGVAQLPSGTVLVTDSDNSRVRAIGADGIISTVHA